MAKRARTDRTKGENRAIRAQVDTFMRQGLPLEQAQAVAFKMFAAGEITAAPTLPKAATIAGLLANQRRKKKRTQQAAIQADIQAGRRTRTGRKRTTKSKGRR